MHKSRIATIALALAMTGTAFGTAAVAKPLPDTIAGEIAVLIPDADVSGMDFSDEQIDRLSLALSSTDDVAQKRALVEAELNEMMASQGAETMSPLPHTMAAEITILIPDANVDDRLFSETQIDELRVALTSTTSPNDKVNLIQSVIDASETKIAGGPEMMLPETVASQVELLIPEADLSGETFTETEIDQIQNILANSDAPATKRASIEVIIGM